MKILLIEDDPGIAEFIRMEMEHEGYEFKCCGDGRSGLESALNFSYDVILLDVMLPELNGFEVLRRLRSHKDTPVIMLTARDAVFDKVAGLDAGANDYVTKPFHIEELFARIRVLTRHRDSDPDDGNVLHNGDLEMDRKRHLVTRAGEQIDLTRTQFSLLEYFMLNKDIVLSREQLLNAVWGYSYVGESNVVDVYVRYVRNKLHEQSDGDLIESVRGIGYVMRTKTNKKA